MSMDATRRGSPQWRPWQYSRVVTYLKENPGRHGITALTVRLRIPGRTIRAIVHSADGFEFVAIIDQQGVGVATTQDEVEEGNRRLSRQVHSLEERLTRRRLFPELPRRQFRLIEANDQ